MLKTWDALLRLFPDGFGQYHEYTDDERDEIVAGFIDSVAKDVAAIEAEEEAG